ncbi:hypothetical protein BH09MYX1_BH09MYX1_63270 [soil metagenome]
MCGPMLHVAASAWVLLFGGLAAATPTLAEATRAFDAEQWEDSAILLDRVVRAGAPFEREVAEYDLAIALHRMGLSNAAYSIFSSIADHPNHARFDVTLIWLAKLALELPEPADVIERVGKYDADAVARFDASAPATYADLSFLLGRYQYRNRRYDDALRTFGTIDRSSPRFVTSQFFCAATNVQLRRSAPAIACLKSAIGALDTVPSATAEDGHLRDLAHLSIARVLYSDSFRLGNDRSPTIYGAKLDAAIDAWSQIDRTSDLWLDALAEQAWAYFMKRDDAHALGNLHTLYAPYFNGTYFPESEVLRSFIYVANCQWEDATVTALAFQRKYLPVADELERTLGRLEASDEEARALELVEKQTVAPSIRTVVARMLGEKSVARQLGYVRYVDAERARFAQKSGSFRSASVGIETADMLQLAHDIALRDLGRLVREHLAREASALDAHLRTTANLVVNVPALILGETDTHRAGGSASALAAITVDQEHVKWRFDGEFWRDELGFYRQSVTSRCGR